MRWIKTIATEVFGLFVDDGNYALTIVIWVAMVGLLRPWANLPSVIEGPVLFGGLAVILFWSAARRARR